MNGPCNQVLRALIQTRFPRIRSICFDLLKVFLRNLELPRNDVTHLGCGVNGSMTTVKKWHKFGTGIEQYQSMNDV